MTCIGVYCQFVSSTSVLEAELNKPRPHSSRLVGSLYSSRGAVAPVLLRHMSYDNMVSTIPRRTVLAAKKWQPQIAAPIEQPSEMPSRPCRPTSNEDEEDGHRAEYAWNWGHWKRWFHGGANSMQEGSMTCKKRKHCETSTTLANNQARSAKLLGMPVPEVPSH
ncbi:uncharacterized protein EI90DRAFT_3028043, partial [Cantharellus anzutake]|uniref:uncharacterized protein n=1 Tax=Cantharellus anzutake TaxID=1750568 RepID=UPI001902D81C